MKPIYIGILMCHQKADFFSAPCNPDDKLMSTQSIMRTVLLECPTKYIAIHVLQFCIMTIIK